MSPYTKFCIPSLSLSQFEGKTKEQKRRKTFMFMDCSIIIYFDTLKVYIIVVKDSCILMLPRGLSCSVFYEFVTSCFLFSFYSPYVILLRIVLLIPLKYHTETGVADYYNIILLRLNLLVHIFHCLGEEGKWPGGCVDGVKFGTPCQRRSV